MSLGIQSSFRSTRVGTTADTTVNGCNIFTARLVCAATAATLKIYNGSTAAANEIARLSAAANSIDETGVPIRCDGTLKVQLSKITALGFIYVR